MRDFLLLLRSPLLSWLVGRCDNALDAIVSDDAADLWVVLFSVLGIDVTSSCQDSLAFSKSALRRSVQMKIILTAEDDELD